MHQFVGSQNVDHAASLAVVLHQVLDIQHGLAKKMLCSLRFQFQQTALYGTDAGGGYIAITGGDRFGILAHMLHHGAQVLEIQQQQAFIIGNLENQRQHSLLHIIQVEHAPYQLRAHVGNRGAYRVTHFTEYIPEGNGVGAMLETFQL